ncbi:Uncharacterized protein BM_BM7938 [Brugia malayi]|uniref:Uncharacterized protein n=1 Tax=Brugia malayi TaxID=6279 RepID=A0A4E9FL76_BRUMA|nr:Uncharacterized protein BM_BM7938 [Brugia malayi]VIO97741.1 Uncharacterized protein BM_BM7938 [Brugia malayi]
MADLPGRESNPGLARDRRGYSPLYYRGLCCEMEEQMSTCNGSIVNRRSETLKAGGPMEGEKRNLMILIEAIYIDLHEMKQMCLERIGQGQGKTNGHYQLLLMTFNDGKVEWTNLKL